MEPPSDKAQKKVHDPLEVESGGCEHDVDGVSEETLVEVAPQAVVALAAPDDRLYPGPLAEEAVPLSLAEAESEAAGTSGMTASVSPVMSCPL